MNASTVTVLVVDDEPVSRGLLARALSAMGTVVEQVDSGDGALARLRMDGPPIDVMLLDLVMPGTDGREVLERVRADANLDDLAIVVVSGIDDADVIADAITRGATDYLVKPFAGPVLRARVEACVASRRLREQERDTLRLVQVLAEAARAVESTHPVPAALHELGDRTDEIGDLARVVSAMARQVAQREASLRRQVTELRIQLDQRRRIDAVAEISGTDHYRRIRAEAADLRGLFEGGPDVSSA